MFLNENSFFFFTSLDMSSVRAQTYIGAKSTSHHREMLSISLGEVVTGNDSVIQYDIPRNAVIAITANADHLATIFILLDHSMIIPPFKGFIYSVFKVFFSISRIAQNK